MSESPSRPRRALSDDAEIPTAAQPLGDNAWRAVSDGRAPLTGTTDGIVAPMAPRRASALEPLPDESPHSPATPDEPESFRGRAANMCSRIATGFALAGAVLTIVWLLPWVQYATSGLARLGRLVGYAWPLWLGAVVLSGVAYALSRATRRLPLVIASALAVLVHSVAWAPMFISSPAPATGPTLRVASINVDAGRMNAVDLAQQARERHIEVAVVQELTPGTYEALTSAGWDELFPHSWGENSDLKVFSKHPLEEIATIETQRAVAVRVDAPDGAWTIVAGHPGDPGNRHPKLWRIDSRHLADLAEAQDSSVPTAIVGNLNGTAQQAPSLAYRAAGFSDARRQAGNGWLTTWPDGTWFPPYAGLEQVLTGAKARAVHLETFPVGRHRGLIADLTEA